MARDYASTRSSSRGGKKKRGGGSGAPGWMWMLVGLTLGLLVATAIYIHKPVSPRGEVAEPPQMPQVEASAEPKTEQKAPETQMDRDSRFDFYEMLPKYEVVVPAKDYQGPTPEEPALKEPGQYQIQAGAFRTYEDADRLKANMALLGIESRIKQVTNPDKAQTWYRVIVGPSKNLTVINEQLRLLRENKIDGLLIRINPQTG